MEYVQICLKRVEEFAAYARVQIEMENFDKAKAHMFDAETWLKVAKKDLKKAVGK